jgi:hypothetical protein
MPFKEFFIEYGEASQYQIQEVVGKGSYGGVAKFEPSIYFKCVRTSYNIRH